MGYRATPQVRPGLIHAMGLVREALDLLDACAAPPQTTAHLERALAELKTILADPS